jgi:hypothetical protein
MFSVVGKTVPAMRDPTARRGFVLPVGLTAERRPPAPVWPQYIDYSQLFPSDVDTKRVHALNAMP